MILLQFLILAAGFLVLIKAAEYLVEGSGSVAKKMGISSLAIGLTVVAFGTSAPELFVNIISATTGSAGIAVGNVLGSNLANILLILGVVAAIKPIRVQTSTVSKEIPFMVLSSLMVVTMAADVLLDGAVVNVLSRTNGISLLGFFAIFLFYTFAISRKHNHDEGHEIKAHPSWKSIVMIIGGIIGLLIGGQLIVSSASTIATAFGVGQGLIGLTIVAFGTSLPELATAVVAARKGNVDLAVGNIVGSNVFNTYMVLGITSTIQPLAFSPANLIDAIAVVAASILLFVVLFVGKKQVIQRWQGRAFLLLYILYIVYSIVVYTCFKPLCVA